jgi:hypothetical protein
LAGLGRASAHPRCIRETTETLASGAGAKAARWFGWIAFGAAALIFGATPFVLGFLAQRCFRRLLSYLVLFSLGAAAALLPWYFMSWRLPLRIGDPLLLWPSAILSGILWGTFAVTGAYVCRRYCRRRSNSPPC